LDLVDPKLDQRDAPVGNPKLKTSLRYESWISKRSQSDIIFESIKSNFGRNVGRFKETVKGYINGVFGYDCLAVGFHDSVTDRGKGLFWLIVYIPPVI